LRSKNSLKRETNPVRSIKHMNKRLALISILFLPLGYVAAQPTPESLKTKTANQLGLTFSSYAYDEPSLNVKMTALNLGVEYLGTYAFQNDWFVLGQIDYNNGPAKYSGSGTASGIPQYYVNLKAAFGRDFAFDGFVLSPYIGIGYRYLDQALGGVSTTTGAAGYDRRSTYNYLPIGVMHRFAVNDNKAKIETTLEYNYLISGNQYSGLAAANPYLVNQNNVQNSGYGINLTVLYKQNQWGFGPYYKYWNIADSQTNFNRGVADGVRYTYTVKEPANTTNEFGLKMTYSF
jgi:outer membrane protein W